MMVLNLMFWEGDKAQAMALSRLIADLEPQMRRDHIFMFTARFDCDHDQETVEYVSNKFPVLLHKTKRDATGWPNGPNQQMADSYEHLVALYKRGAQFTHVMFIEADCVPLSNNWLNLVYEEAKNSGKKVSGALLKKGDGRCNEHVNGNCIVSIDFYKKCPGMMNPPEKGGWDATLSYAIVPNAHPSRLIWSDYQLGMEHNPWKGCDFLWEAKYYKIKDNPYYGQRIFPVWFHGCKGMEAINCVRNTLLSENNPLTAT